MRLLIAVALCVMSVPALACEIDGDSIAVGLASLMPECRHSAKSGITSDAVAARVRGGSLVIASAGSNDWAQLDRIPPALDRILAHAHGRLLLILPANNARGVVAGWAAEHGVPTVGFTPGGDGIHPRSYRELASRVRAAL